MTRKKNWVNRKKANKITAYLTDPLLEYLKIEMERTNMSQSKIIQEALSLHQGQRHD